MTDLPTAFHDLPEEKFPFKTEFLDEFGNVVHTIEVTGPGSVYIPPLHREYGPVSVKMTFADGEVLTEGPPKGE